MNALKNETSPYLLQHAANPVEWYPWSPAALARARELDRPILLSIGYAACHWCHVMAHESFEDEATAQLMNESFVNIKVDREERPDLDSIYMQAVQAMTGSGGWPMTVFLTPDGVPFFGGTYFPKHDRHGLPSFARVLQGVAHAYRAQPDRVAETARALRGILSAPSQPPASGALTDAGFNQAVRLLTASYDERYAGFGDAPKFPPSMTLRFLLIHWSRTGDEKALSMVRDTYLAMFRGGIYDQVGGGLHRYAVDDRWLVPHFEKMLYDNALFVGVGVALWKVTHDDEVRRGVEETLTWLRREMTSPEGGFYSSLDADSEGHEGRFYTWSDAELRRIAGTDFEIVRDVWGVSEAGNFEGANILHVARPSRGNAPCDPAARSAMARVRESLYAARGRRVWPARDEKVVTSWNALMLRSISQAAAAFEDANLRDVALANADFLWRTLVRDARVFRIYKSGQVKVPGFLEDQASLALALMDVYELTFDDQWIGRALELTRATVAHFCDRTSGLFFDAAHDHETLVTRPRDVADNATPSGQSLVAELLLRAAEFAGDETWRSLGEGVLGQLWEIAVRNPLGFGNLLAVADIAVNGAVQVVLSGAPESDGVRVLHRVVAQKFVPSLVLGGADHGSRLPLALTAGKLAIDGMATAYVCRRYVCDAPTHHREELATQLERAILPVT
ncbi:MAG: hypothetical protein MNPFHGCM_01828 [Gemmatimonadaceae bacterium]|nr:hypothetical protein [Gemmatimonadaceae bacterium]